MKVLTEGRFSMSEVPLYSMALPMARRPVFLSMGLLAFTYGPAYFLPFRGSRFLSLAISTHLKLQFSVAQGFSGPDVACFRRGSPHWCAQIDQYPNL